MGWRLGLMVWAIAATLLVFLGLAGKLPVILVVGGICLVAWLMGIALAVMDYRQRRMARREKYRHHRRRVEKVNRAMSLKAQLSKPDFEVRMRGFNKSVAEAKDRNPEDDLSNMVFWQLEGSYTRTPTRSQTFFAYLLRRISRLVRQGQR